MPSQSSPEFVIQKKVLERQRFHKSLRVQNNEEVLGIFASESMEGSVEYDLDFNQWIIRMEMDVLAEHLADDYYQEILTTAGPTTVWDMFKETYGGRWWMRRWVVKHPPKYTHKNHLVQVKVERWVKYPSADIMPDKRLGRAIPMERLERIYPDD